MKVIDLVHKRENKEKMPKNIIYNGEIYHYNGSNYFTEFVGGMRMTFDFSDLDRNIEIIEEEAEIEELQLFGYDQFYYMNKEEQYRKLTEEYNKINELVRVMNKLNGDRNE
ncbi:MAG: hypothetical protein J6B89_03545 [Bacilli bacterium]|nr:hypothetical protein [Bacilli bacterium]